MPEQYANEGSYTTYEEQPCSYFPDIDTEDLTEEQLLIETKKFVEEAESISKTNNGVGRAEELQVDINLTSSVPEAHCYSPTTFCRRQAVCWGSVESRVDSKVKVSYIRLRLYVFVKRMGHSESA